MADQDRCRGCGKKRPSDAPGGLCPVCLLRGGLVGGDSAGSSAVLAAGLTSGGGVLGTLAATLGPVPRVLLRDTEPVTGPGPMVRPSSPEMPGPTDRSCRLQLLGEVARGGMGAILKGRDTDLGRDLAIKVLLEQHRDNPDLTRRFIEEAQIAGQLQHPGVVPVYELGALADHRPYFAMKLVKGRTLATLLDERPGPEEDRPRLLGIFEQICLTVAYAHARGVIHRDLKPSNVMVGSFGEVQVMDWGLAKVLPQGGVADDLSAGRVPHETVIQTARTGSDSDASLSGSIMGTPAYMPPEQASGDVERLDERADVFALGSILCEILTGQPAFTGRTVGEIQRKAARGDLTDAYGRLLACVADAELVAVVKDCLAIEPEDRPRDAAVVAGRLTAYMTGVQVRLRTAELARVEAQARAEEEAKRRVLADALASEAQAHAIEERRRRRLQVGLAASLLALTTIGGLGSTAFLQQRQAHAARVELTLKEATLLRDQSRAAADDLNRWQAAREAVKRVEVALGEGDDDGARQRVQDLRREVEAGTASARHDRELLEALADIRGSELDLGPGATDVAYADAFRHAGIDLDALPPAEAAARLRARPAAVVRSLVGYLDSWSATRRSDEQPAQRWRRPLSVARATDPDPYRDRLRALVEREDLKSQSEALHALSEDRQVAELAPASTLLLASALKQANDLPGAVAVLERAAQRHPGDVWINYNLAELLSELPTPKREEAVRYYTTARALRPETAHNLAHLLDRMGRGEDAIATFRELVRVRPSNAKNLGCLGTTLLHQRHPEEGLETLDRAIAAARESIRRQPGDAAHYNTLGYTLQAKGDRDGAIAAYREALRIKPGYTTAVANLVARLKAKGDVDGTIDVLRTAIRARPDHARSHHDLSQALQEKGDLDGAIAAIREAIRLSPHVAGYRSHFSALLKAQGHDDSIAVTPASVGIKTDDFAAHFALGLKLQERKNLKGAAAEFHAAVRLKPDNASARDWLGWVLMEQGDHDGAIVELREALRLEPEHIYAHRNLGAALKAKGDLDGAIASFRKAIRIKPADSSSRDQLLDALKAKGGYSSGTKAAYLDAYGIKTDNLAGLIKLGTTLRDGDSLDAAIAVFHEALRLKPDSAAAHSRLGGTLRQKGELDAALAECREGIRLNPNDPAGHTNLGYVLRDKRDLDAAIAEFRTVVRLAPDNWTSHGDLGFTLRAKGDLEGAIAEYREVIRCKPDRYQAHGNLGLMLRDKGDMEGAVAAFREQFRLKPDLASALDNLIDALKARRRRNDMIATAIFKEPRFDPNLAVALNTLMTPLKAKVQPDEAIALLDDLVRAQPEQAGYRLARGRTLVELGRRDEAATDFARALSVVTPPSNLWQVEDPSGAYPAAVADPEVFELLTWFRPEDRKVWNARVRHLVRQRQWQEATALLARSNALEPPGHLAWHYEGPLWLWLGDNENYRRVCRGMVERFGSTSDPIIAERTLQTCMLQPDALPERRVTEHLLERFRTIASSQKRVWSQVTEALYECRSGRFRAVIERLSFISNAAIATEQQKVQKAIACAILALAHAKLGQADEARRQLATAGVVASQAEYVPERGDRLSSNWNDWFWYHVLRREAEALLRDPASLPTRDPGQATSASRDEALSAFFLEQFRAIDALVQSDIDQAEKTLGRLKEQVAALAPTKDESRTLVQRGKTTIRYYEEMIAEARVPRTERDERLKANADDLDALSKYTTKITKEIFPLVSSNPELARRQIASAKEFLTGLKARAKEETKSKIDQSLNSLTRVEAQIDAEKTRAHLVGQKAAPLGVETWINGSPLTDLDLEGKVVLLDFWAVWCGPCIATFPHLREWNEKYADKGLVMIGLTNYFNYDWDAKADKAVHSQGTVPAEKEQAMLVKFAAQHKLTHRLGIGSDYPFSKYYGVTGIPQAVVIDREGVVRLLCVGNREANVKAIGDLLEKLFESGRNAGD